MATKMLMPLLGQTMEEGTIIRWLKQEGDQIKAGEPLLEVMTDKVNMEVEAPESGVLLKVIAQADNIVPVKDPICLIGTAHEPINDLLVDAASQTEEARVPVDRTPLPEPVSTAPAVSVTSAVALAEVGRVFASPAAKRIAREHGVEIAAMAGRGTGPGGRIVEKDVVEFVGPARRATPLAGKMSADLGIVAGTGIGGRVTSDDIKEAAAPTPATPLSIGAKIPYVGTRKTVGENVSRSAQTVPHVTLVTEVDMTECVALRKQILPDIERNYGVRISFTDIITKAVARAILDRPIVNSSLVGDGIIIHDGINIGIAAAVDGALVVPVIKDAAAKTIPQISREIKEMVGRAREGRADGEDTRGGTFSISNLGAYGIESFNPIITPGQSAILGVCAIKERPTISNEEIRARPMMNLCLSFNHRVMDGAPAAEFLKRLKEILESPYLIFV